MAWSLPPRTPSIAVHYASGVPFRSMMALDEQSRHELLSSGLVSNPERYADPTYVETRLRIETEMYEQFIELGGQPRLRSPHYALLGRSARMESMSASRRRAYGIPLDVLSPLQVSFTWDDSFAFDPTFRRLTGKDHPASGQVYRLDRLGEILERWGPTTERPAWHWIELQLWFSPGEGEFEVLEPLRES